MNKPEFLNQGTKAPFSARYENFIGGQWVAPRLGFLLRETSPITGRVICEVARSEAADVDKALDARPRGERGLGPHLVQRARRILNRIADRMEDNLDLIALAETGTTASRSARPPTPIFPSPSTTGATSPVACGAEGAISESTTTRWPTTSTSPSASSARSSRGTSPS